MSSARSAVASASSVGESAQAEADLAGALKSLFALAEKYPDFKANKGFLRLQAELADTEDQIAMARQFYNDSIMNYDITRQKVPSNLVASVFGFTEEREYFEPEALTDRAAPEVTLS